MCTAGLHKTQFSGKLAKEQLSGTGGTEMKFAKQLKELKGHLIS